MRRILVFLCGVLFIFGMICSANATILSTFTAESDFLSAIKTPIMESFENVPSGTLLPAKFEDVTVSDFTNWDSGNKVDDYSYYCSDGSQSLQIIMSADDYITFDFDFAIDAFGINLNNFDTTGKAYLFFSNELGDQYTFNPTSVDETSFEFIGLTTDVGFVSVTLTSIGYAIGDGMSFDEMYYQAAAPVPEPTTILLFSIGLTGLAGTVRKKKLKK